MKIEELTSDMAAAKVSPPEAGQGSEPEPDLLELALEAYEKQHPSPTTTQDGTTPTPALPPHLAALQNKTTQEKLDDLNKSPLFMTNLEDNDDLEALKVLAYEGTPLEVATGFKERGNEEFAQGVKSYKDAKEFYSKGINVLLIEVRKRQKGQETLGPTEDVAGEVKTLEACLVNRAACHLGLKNYRSCILDCGSALRINGRNVKAFYRSSKALLALAKIEEADDACARGLAIDPENKALLGVADEIIKRHEVEKEKRRKEVERENRKRLEEVTKRAALKARGIKTRKTEQPPEMEDAKIELVPDPVDPTSTLSFPTVLLYPLALESDFIKAFNETEPLGHHLDYILPVPWDREGIYTPMGVECYMETIAGGLIKVGRKVTLLKVLSTGNVEVVDEVVKIFVVPKDRAAEWVRDFKAKKAALLAEKKG